MTSFPIPASAQKTPGTTSSSTGDESEKTDYTIEDFLFLLERGLMPKKRGDAREKGIRLVSTGRLTVKTKHEGLVVAECKGDSGAIYHLGHDPRKHQWRCTCPAKGACSHLYALWLVCPVARRDD